MKISPEPVETLTREDKSTLQRIIDNEQVLKLANLPMKSDLESDLVFFKFGNNYSSNYAESMNARQSNGISFAEKSDEDAQLFLLYEEVENNFRK